jgi:hypothetical protein
MNINFQKIILGISFTIFLILLLAYMYLYKDIKNTAVVQSTKEYVNAIQEDSPDNSKAFSYWEILNIICRDDRVQIIKLENSEALQSSIRADIKIDGNREELEEFLDYLATICDSVRINRIFMRDNKGMKSATLSLEFTDVN